MTKERLKICMCGYNSSRTIDGVNKIIRDVSSTQFGRIPPVIIRNIKYDIGVNNSRILDTENVCDVDLKEEKELANKISGNITLKLIIKANTQEEFTKSREEIVRNLNIMKDNIIKKLGQCTATERGG